MDELLREILADKAYYEASGGDVTFSGGECMLQIEALRKLLMKCKENGIHTAVDTAGNVPWASFESILPYTDLFLYDVKCFSEKLHIEGTQVPNKLILENLRKLASEFEGAILVRIPVIPGFNDDEEELGRIAAYLKELHITDVELLPYHRMGEHKYEAAGMEFTAYTVPEKLQMDAYKRLFGSNE